MFEKKDYKTVGESTLKVSPITLGTMTFGDQNTQQDAFEQLDFALNRGINSFDLAEMYRFWYAGAQVGGSARYSKKLIM